MIRTCAGLMVLLTSITLAAQNGMNSSSEWKGASAQFPAQPLADWTDSERCPVDMHASQGLWNHTIAVQKGLGDQKFGQRISLSLKDGHSARIISATVRVFGLSGSTRMVPTPAKNSQRWNTTKTLRVELVEEPDGTVSGDLWIGGFTAVDTVRLLSVSYSDGTRRAISGSSACRVQPDPIMLITER